MIPKVFTVIPTMTGYEVCLSDTGRPVTQRHDVHAAWGVAGRLNQAANSGRLTDALIRLRSDPDA